TAGNRVAGIGGVRRASCPDVADTVTLGGMTNQGATGRAMGRTGLAGILLGAMLILLPPGAPAQENIHTIKPELHGQHWMVVAGKPLAATAGAKTFIAGGNAVDAAAATLAASATMWD